MCRQCQKSFILKIGKVENQSVNGQGEEEEGPVNLYSMSEWERANPHHSRRLTGLHNLKILCTKTFIMQQDLRM